MRKIRDQKRSFPRSVDRSECAQIRYIHRGSRGFLRRKNTKIGGLRRTGAYEMLLLSEKPSHLEQLQVGEVLNCQPHAEPIAASNQTEDSIAETKKNLLVNILIDNVPSI